MRLNFVIGCVLFLSDVAACPALEPREAESGTAAVRASLREASELALKQPKHQDYWRQLVLLQIGAVQIRAGDFDGALRSIRGSSYDYGRNGAMKDLAEALARNGDRKQAFEIVRLIDSSCRDAGLEDRVQLRWIEWQISSGSLGDAGKAIGELKSQQYRSEGLRKLAVAYAASGDAAHGDEYFKLAIDAAVLVKEEFNRAWHLWEVADVQRSAKRLDDAKATNRIVETIEFKDPWAKFKALKQFAIFAAKANDEKTARRLFGQAIEAGKSVNELNKINALQQIAGAQAEVGYLNDALKTAWMIKRDDEKDLRTRIDGDREESLYVIAVAQLKANDIDGAMRTTLSLEYRDDALGKIVDYQIVKRNLAAALTTAQKIDNPSLKATAMLNVATAQARSGDRKAATGVAKQIGLTSERFGVKEQFDHRLPRSWGVRYEFSFTMGTRFTSVQHAAEVAAAAMTLSQSLEQKPAQSYAILFNEITDDEVTQALARAHAVSGDAREALTWAKQIGSDVTVKSENDDAQSALTRRIHALIGAAEGILDRSSNGPPKPVP